MSNSNDKYREEEEEEEEEEEKRQIRIIHGNFEPKLKKTNKTKRKTITKALTRKFSAPSFGSMSVWISGCANAETFFR
jgi:hypothetical protein